MTPEEERDALGKALYNVLYNLHRTYGSTAGPYGGIGGQAITTFCHVKDPYTDADQTMNDEADQVLRTWVRGKEERGEELELKNV